MIASLQVNDYATCLSDGFWWLVLVDTINEEEKDITCKFMHPHGPTNNFHWPSTDDKGYVPFDKIIMKVKTLRCSINGRQYSLDDDEVKKTKLYFDNIIGTS